MAAEPLVSVIMCVLDGERYLPDALASVAAQSYPHLEVVFVDDGSTDRTAAIAQRVAGVRYVYQENAGTPAARNNGLRHARGDLIAFLDGDDWWTPSKTAQQVGLLGSDPELDIVLGHTRRTWVTDGQHPTETDPELALSLCAGLIRRTVFDRVGGFDQTLTYCDDWDWFMRARESGIAVATHPETVLYYRRHDGNLSNNTEAGTRDFARVLKASLDRRRSRDETGLEGRREPE